MSGDVTSTRLMPGQTRQLLPHFRHGVTSRNDGYHDTKAHHRSMDGIVANATRALKHLAAVYRLSVRASPMDRPSAVAGWVCSCSARPVARLWAVDGLQRKAFWEHSSGVFPIVPCWCHRFFLGCTAHPRRVRSCFASRAASAGFYAAGQRRTFCFDAAVVLWFSGTPRSRTRLMQAACPAVHQAPRPAVAVCLPCSTQTGYRHLRNCHS